MSEWIQWDGGERPVESNDVVEVRTREGQQSKNIGLTFSWAHYWMDSDIVAYKLADATLTNEGTKLGQANEVQVGGNHYKSKGIEPWDYIVANAIPYLEGNVVKYVTRWRDKGGIDDLRKARHYLDKLIETETAK